MSEEIKIRYRDLSFILKVAVCILFIQLGLAIYELMSLIMEILLLSIL